jgi:hypothetical protein
MIPKRAFFLWVGEGDLPWLRQVSIDSFRKHNPEWEVDLVRVPSRCEMVSAQATDIFRYNELATRGGLYLDTDIVFFRPVPEEMLEKDLAFTLDKGPLLIGSNPQNEHLPGFTNLAFMGSSGNSEFFRYVYDAAQERAERFHERKVDLKDPGAYQLLGVNLLNGLFYRRTLEEIERQFNETIYNVPLDTVLPIPWYSTFKLFNGTLFEPNPGTIGVHWYGDCIEARRYCSQVTAENYERRPCYLSNALSRALA